MTAVMKRRPRAKKPREGRDAVEQYAFDVLDGRIPACRLVKLACERHIKDLKDGHKRGLNWDWPAAERVINFFRFLQHRKGEWARTAIELQPWQQFRIGSVFGWKREDGTRRFRVAHHEVPRKNGKTTEAAGTGNYLAFFDDEPGAEVYATATKRDQARFVFDEARWQAGKDPLKRRVQVWAHNMHMVSTASKFEPLGSDSDSTDGLNTHGEIRDEFHAWKDREFVEKLDGARGSRRQPLTWIITTAGLYRDSPWWDSREYAIKVLEGVLDDDELFAYISTPDEGDDWQDEAVWWKVNPNLGVSVKLDYLRAKCKRAQEIPSEQNSFRRQYLNEPTEQVTRWLDMSLWAEQEERTPLEELKGKPCVSFLDLSATTDITAFVLLFMDEDGQGCDVLPYFWIPQESMQARARRDRVPYDAWARDGLLEVTEGDVVDQVLIRHRVNEIGAEFQLQEVAFDPWNATKIATELGETDGFQMVTMRQGFASLSAPSKEMERMLHRRKFRHGNNAVMRWMASNVAVRTDPAGNIKPDKEKSTEKIDGIVAAIGALGRGIVRVEEAPSVYEERGLRKL